MKEVHSFKMSGVGITDHIRHRFISGDAEGGLKVFNCLIPDDPLQVPNFDTLLKDILLGNRGFKGVTPDVYLDEDAQNEDLTLDVLRAAFQAKNSSLEFVTKILDLDDPIEYLVECLRHTHRNVREFVSGWISKRGVFVPAGFSKHDQVCYDIDEEFHLNLYNPVQHFEQQWVRVSNAYRGNYFIIQFRGEELTDEQKDAILQYAKINEDAKKGDYIFIGGYGFVKDGIFHKEVK